LESKNSHDLCDCSLCLAVEKEEPIYKDDKITILETKNLKGHKRRIMAVWQKHNDLHFTGHSLDELLWRLTNVGLQVFNYTEKFVIMSTKFATIRDHYHLVATDLEPDSEDFRQILGTPWVKVVHVRDWDHVQPFPSAPSLFST